jgi:hypothetical protein
MFKKIYYTIILFGCGTKAPEFVRKNFPISQGEFELDLTEKTQYLIKLLMTFTPIAYLLNLFNVWFPDNKTFFQVLVWTILANVIVGACYHFKSKTFNIKTLLWKNIEMCLIIIVTYPILEGLYSITGQNIAGEVFKWAIQISTILYPGSKVLKNIHILSNKKYPPQFLMDRIFKFEKDGDVGELLGKNDENNTNIPNYETTDNIGN